MVSGDPVTWSDGAWWWNGRINRVCKRTVWLEDEVGTRGIIVQHSEIRYGHSECWSQVQAKFDTNLYKSY